MKRKQKIFAKKILNSISILLFLSISLNPLLNNYIRSDGESSRKIIFDESHYPITTCSVLSLNPSMTKKGGYGAFKSDLLDNNYTVDTINFGTTITNSTLSSYEIMIIVGSQTNYTNSEINVITNWIHDGGSLLLITDSYSLGAGVYDLTLELGFEYPVCDCLKFDENYLNGNDEFFYLTGDEIQDYVQGIKCTEITDNLERIEMYSATGIITKPTFGITLLNAGFYSEWANCEDEIEQAPLFVSYNGWDLGDGKVIIITDYSIWSSAIDSDNDGTNNYWDSDNSKLAINTINWLNKPILKFDPSGTFDIFSSAFLVIIVLTFTAYQILSKKRKRKH
jgi:hypothetical protein